jgi:transposase
MPQLWAGIDAGKGHHHCVVIDESGTRLLSRRIVNQEAEILGLLSDVVALAGTGRVSWATDLTGGAAGLLLAILAHHQQQVLYVPGRAVYHAARTYRGDGKTDAKDAGIIADQARMRRDLQPRRADDAVSTELQLLAARRGDLVADRTRAINRLRAALLNYFPALEAEFDFAKMKAAVILVSRYQTPDKLRKAGPGRLTTWLKSRNCYRPAAVAERAIAAASRQHATVAGQSVSAAIVAGLAADILRLHKTIDDIERQISSRLEDYRPAELLQTIPGFGPLLTAEFIASTGGSITQFDSADRLAGVAGLAPAPRDSGRITGNHHRPKRYDRRLLRVCYLAAQTAVTCCPLSAAYYQRKRTEGKTHKQAVIALARRRINVIWAMLRDDTTFNPTAAETPHLA